MKSVKALAPAIAVCVLTVLGACGEAVRRYSDVGAAENWPSHGGGADESGFSRLKSINTRTVGKLGLEYALDLPGEVSLEATPLAVDGVLYFTGSYSAVYAVDAASGKLLWKHDPEVWRHNPRKMRFTFPVNRGAAYENGRVFSATLDGRLLALDAKTGKLLWTAQTVDLDSFHTITGAPRTLNGKVIIGNGGGDFGARGYVTAYDAATGRQLWRFYTVPGRPEENRGDPAMERAAATWSGEYWKTGTGGTVWNGITFDPELNRVYIGTGNAGPYDPALRSPGGGDNLYLASIVALDASTGKYVWHYQVNPREAWDYKATANMISATLQVEGKSRKVLMQAPTNGFFYVIDRETGKLISAEKTGKVTWAERIDLQTGRPVEAKNIRYETGETVIWPGNQGGHNWQDMAFSPKSGLVYIPYMQAGVRLRKGQPLAPGETSYGGLTISLVKADDNDGKGALIAWDPVAQKARWRVPHEEMWNGGALATAGDLVFQGSADGHLSAYNAGTGERLWRFYAGQGIISPPISYSAGSKQYVSVLVGFGGTAGILSNFMDAGWRFNAPRRLLTFSLDGKATLPPTPARHTPLKPLDDPTLKLKPADVTAGQLLYGMNCAVCHGFALRSAGAPGPDLRESQIALDGEALWSVLHEGALRPSGMPQFQELSRQQVGQIQAYIRAGAREALGKSEIKTPDVAPGRM